VAYTIRANEIPASSGYGEPITKFFKLGDGVRLVAAVTADPRFVPESVKGAKGDPPGPYLISAAKSGLVSRQPFAPYRIESTKVGRRFARLNDGDRIVMTALIDDETSVFLAAASGHVIHFAISEIPVLSGAGKGVVGIKLDDDDACLGGALIGNRHDACVVETSGGRIHELRRGACAMTHRGGKGFEVVKRSNLIRVVPSRIELVNWEEIETNEQSGKSLRQRKSLFE
jgi:DNA gyrase subunit A